LNHKASLRGGKTHLGVKVEDLFRPEGALKAAFAGFLRRQVLLQLVQRAQRRAARTGITETTRIILGSGCIARGLKQRKQSMTRAMPIAQCLPSSASASRHCLQLRISIIINDT